MIATLTIIAIAFYWMLHETDWLRVRLAVGAVRKAVELDTETIARVKALVKEALETEQLKPQPIKALPASAPVLSLPVGNPANYPMTLTTTVKELKALLDQLSKTELELTEEVYEYDYSDQT